MSRALLIVGGIAAAGLALYVVKKGGVSQAASAIGAGAVNAAGGAVSGAVGAVGASVGLPTPSETTTDPAVSRWLIDNAGHMEASKWSGALAYGRALFLPAGSGTPPPAGSDVARQFGGLLGARSNDTGDETARLLARYPGATTREPSSIFSGAGSFSDGATGGYFDLYGTNPMPLF
ncbi:hypothetical protein [Roseateles violae]|uniref:Uncharacterized protein n=1 Tax=Roseateles violae TaxID=3058042 RepID=A0ABT8E0H7_9BURK|nr:hypothetical protein [Pelomonas sp. PFR6]MDN3923319.1 hypothetical protein [Pelomonas sp. PFR6]